MYKYIVIGLLAVAVMAPTGIALAQQATTTTATSELSTAGDLITPASVLFPIKQFFENVGTFFTFGAAAKTQRYLNLAARRLAEAQQLAREGSDKAQEAVDLYQQELEKAKQKAEDTNNEDLLTKVTDATNRHIDVLQNVLSKVPEQAKTSIEQNIERIKEQRQNLIERLQSLPAVQRTQEMMQERDQEHLGTASTTASSTDNETPENEGKLMQQLHAVPNPLMMPPTKEGDSSDTEDISPLQKFQMHLQQQEMEHQSEGD